MGLTRQEKEDLFNEFKKMLNDKIPVSVEICREKAKLPEYANIGDAGMDVRAAEEVIILPGETKIIPTGLKMAIPEGYEIEVRPRSGLSLKTPLRVANSPGTIDSGYRDEIGIIMANTSSPSNNEYYIDEKGNKPGIYKIQAGDRIAQFVLNKVEQIEFNQVDDVKSLGINRNGGFGSTGTN